MTIHPAAAKGFERGARDYEIGRPSYPVAVVDHVAGVFGLGPGKVLLDVGCGPGTFTRLFRSTGATLVGVEPVAAMRSVFSEVLPECSVLDGRAEHLPIGDASVHAVTAAQSFHWFDPERALEEVHRVLVSGGGLALVWNARDEAVPWVAQVTNVMDRVAGDAPRYRRGTPGPWHLALEAHEGFGPVTELAFPNDVTTDLDRFLARVASTSYVSALDDDDRRSVLDEVAAILREGPLRDGSGDLVEPYVTEVFWCRRR